MSSPGETGQRDTARASSMPLAREDLSDSDSGQADTTGVVSPGIADRDQGDDGEGESDTLPDVDLGISYQVPQVDREIHESEESPDDGIDSGELLASSRSLGSPQGDEVGESDLPENQYETLHCEYGITGRDDVIGGNDITGRNDVIGGNDITCRNDVTSDNEISHGNDVTSDNGRKLSPSIIPETHSGTSSDDNHSYSQVISGDSGGDSSTYSSVNLTSSSTSWSSDPSHYGWPYPSVPGWGCEYPSVTISPPWDVGRSAHGDGHAGCKDPLWQPPKCPEMA